MKVLLDECVDWRLSLDILGHEVRTVRQMGWATIKNGELLSRAAENFDVLSRFIEICPSNRTSVRYRLLSLSFRPGPIGWPNCGL